MGMVQPLHILCPLWGPGRENHCLFFTCTEHQESLHLNAQMRKDGPHRPDQQRAGTRCVHGIFITHLGAPELRLVIPQTLLEHHADGRGAGLGAGEPAPLRCFTAVGLGKSCLWPLTAASSSVRWG